MPKHSLKKSTFQTLFCCICTLLFVNTTVKAQYTDLINSNRPGMSMGAYSVGLGVYQMEGQFFVDRFKGALLQSESFYNNSMVALRVGILKESVEIIYEGAYTFESSTSPIPGGKISTEQGMLVNRIGAKVMLYDPFKNPKNRPVNVYSWKKNNRFNWRNLLPAVALYGGANIGLKNSPYLSENKSFTPRAIIITQSALTPKMVLILNGIYDYIGDNLLEEKTLIASLSHALNRKWSVFIEGQYSIYNAYKDQIFRAGGAYLLNKNLQFDVFGGMNFQDEPAKATIGLGFSYRLDRHKNLAYD